MKNQNLTIQFLESLDVCGFYKIESNGKMYDVKLLTKSKSNDSLSNIAFEVSATDEELENICKDKNLMFFRTSCTSCLISEDVVSMISFSKKEN